MLGRFKGRAGENVPSSRLICSSAHWRPFSPDALSRRVFPRQQIDSRQFVTGLKKSELHFIAQYLLTNEPSRYIMPFVHATRCRIVSVLMS